MTAKTSNEHYIVTHTHTHTHTQTHRHTDTHTHTHTHIHTTNTTTAQIVDVIFLGLDPRWLPESP